MGCVFSKKNKVEIEVADIIDNWYTNSMKLWPKTEKARKHFLGIERTPINSSKFSGSSDIGLDTIH